MGAKGYAVIYSTDGYREEYLHRRRRDPSAQAGTPIKETFKAVRVT